MSKQVFRRIAVYVLFAGAFQSLPAALEVGAIFSNNMVLQRNKTIKIWGWGGSGSVEVAIGANKATSKKLADGRWLAELSPMAAGGLHTVTVNSGSERAEIKNVLIGDVWICAGQSNMYYTFLKGGNNFHSEYENDHPTLDVDNIRMIKLENGASSKPALDFKTGLPWPFGSRDRDAHKMLINDQWAVGTADNARSASAVAWYFAEHVEKELNVPIGLIEISEGFTTVAAWSVPDNIGSPSRYGSIGDKGKLYHMFNGCIHPLKGMAIRGFIWWQGENECLWDRDQLPDYKDRFFKLIPDYRRLWGLGDFSFLITQLQRFNPNTPTVREIQLYALTMPKTSLAVICDSLDGTHPEQHRRVVGYRLALGALHHEYGKNVTWLGPVYRKVEFSGNTARIHFDHIGSGLSVGPYGQLAAKQGDLWPAGRCKDAQVTSFMIRAESGKYVMAGNVAIDGNTVVVSDPAIDKVAGVQYGFHACPLMTLYNKEGLPASPFRTDGPFGAEGPFADQPAVAVGDNAVLRPIQNRFSHAISFMPKPGNHVFDIRGRYIESNENTRINSRISGIYLIRPPAER